VRRLRGLPKPVVCAVNGIAAGAGANVALACDLVLAARSASFVQSFARLGLIPDSGGTYFLPRLAGTARAMGLALLGEKLSAEDAERWGLIWKAVDDGQAARRGERACARAGSRADEGLRPGKEGDLRLGRQLARGAARSRARPAARRGIFRGLSRRRVGLPGEARAALPGQVNAFPLEPIEKAPRGELQKLQLERLRWTLQHAYDNVPHYRRKFDAAG